ncbi:hypothetical protein PCASD_02956 [Puccinia coronata f. sp. avenae]|uniref:Uncharacterized protein n=1 Tax=Puccinia coronata f. sp. avenae TaxID=200324 RepID=A0A2N5VEA1_9BASI|nr:hypothetical protein PCASD_02956 [Puccinia coronata f. sp. avenae]
MAKLSDLPPELVSRIVHLVCYPSGPRLDTMWGIHPNHLPEHFNCSLQPHPRPHLDRIVYFPQDHPKDYDMHVSWSEGLPANPLVPLSLVNRAFCQCAQAFLFNNVDLNSTVTARLFLKSLTSIRSQKGTSSHKPQLQLGGNQPKQHGPPRPLNPLAHHVRSLQFAWTIHCVMEKYEGSIVCEILQSCPCLENIVISNVSLLGCKEPILQVLASKPLIKEFVILRNKRSLENSPAQWQAREVVLRLFSHWNALETVEFTDLSGWPDYSSKSASDLMPMLNCAIRTMILKDQDLDPLTLANLLTSCGESMRDLTITGPGDRLHREGLCWILQECTSPNLESLTLKSIYWDPPIHPDPNSENPSFNPALLDILFNSPTAALKNLKILSFDGRMATAKLLERLPQSLVRLSWERCKLPASAFIKALLLSPKGTQGSLPNLKCCSCRTRFPWDKQDECQVVEALKMEGGCSHSVIHRGWPRITLSEDETTEDDSSSFEDDDSPSEYNSSDWEHEPSSSDDQHDSTSSEHDSSSASHVSRDGDTSSPPEHD